MTKEDRAIVERMKEIRELFTEFGLILLGFGPGVVAYSCDKKKTRTFDFEAHEWEWLEPLLIELRNLRRNQTRVRKDISLT